MKDPGVGEKIILKGHLKKWDSGVDWIDRAQNRHRLQALVNAVMKFRVPCIAGNFLTS